MASPRELAEQAFALMQDALRDAESRVAELSEQLEQSRQPKGPAEEQLDELRRQLEGAEADRQRFEREASQLEEAVAAEQAKTDQLKKKLDIAESGPDKLTKKEINFWRAKAEEFDQASSDYKSRLAQLRHELKAKDDEIERLTQQADEHARAGAEAAESLAEMERLRDTLKEREAKLTELSAELEQTRAELANRQDQHRQAVDELQQRHAALEEETRSAREQISGLEHELLEEKERTDNLSEIANERRELIAQLEDRLAEAEERHEEAKWRLGKAQHFERLVRRRKGLIKALLERIRAKSKANTALKAGLDGLRTYKAAAEARQHELLGRIDKLRAKIEEQEETISQHNVDAQAGQRLEEATARVAELEKRIEAQIEIIGTLEEELKASKARKQLDADQRGEIETLQRELASKSELITKLQEDADEQQRKLAKLRSSETQTLRQQALSVQSKSRMDALEREIAELKDANAELTRTADGWRRKYEFLSSDEPTEFKTAAEK